MTRWRGRQSVTAYAVAVGVTAVMDAAWLALPRGLGDHIPFSLFLIVVGGAALLGGVGPGMVAVVLGLLSASYIGVPRFQWTLHHESDWVLLVIFAVTGPLVAVGCAQLRRARQEASRLNAELHETLDRERAARAELERAARLKDEFLATVSHELRTPLNAVVGWAELLQRPGTDRDRVLRGLTVIQRNGRALAQIVGDLLDVSRMVAGKVRLDLARTSLPETVAGALEGLRGAVEAKRIEVTTDLAPVEVLGDASRLQQVVWNLVSNAVKFTPEGGRVEVTVGRTEDGHVVLRVRDDGEGIAPDLLPHVFERFWQADASITRRHGGLGLGLAICRHLVELHGGTIRAASEGPGRGAQVEVTLPPPPPGAREAHDPRAPPSARALAGVTVLVVDDDDDARELAQRILEEHGASVLAVSSGREALESLAASRPDILVSDIGMPDIDGYELVRRLRAGPEGSAPRLPAVALTAYARSEDRAIAIAVGFQGHVAKPVDAGELVAAVERATRGAEGEAPVRERG